MPKESHLEIKVGAFVLIAAITLVTFVFSISDFSIFDKGASYGVIFDFANGLKKGSPVRVAGVDAGHIRDISVFYDEEDRKTKVKADIWISDEVQIPKTSKFVINQLGILGEKYLEIVPAKDNDFAKSRMVFQGEDPIPMDEIFKSVSGLGGQFQETLANVNEGMLSVENQEALAIILANLAQATSLMKGDQGTVGLLLTDKQMYENLAEFTADLKENPWKLFYRPSKK